MLSDIEILRNRIKSQLRKAEQDFEEAYAKNEKNGCYSRELHGARRIVQTLEWVLDQMPTPKE